MPAKLSGKAVDVAIRAKHGGKIFMKSVEDYRGIDTKQAFIDDTRDEYLEFSNTPYEVRKGSGSPKYRLLKMNESKRLKLSETDPDRGDAVAVNQRILKLTDGRVSMKDLQEFKSVGIKQEFIETLPDGRVFEFTTTASEFLNNGRMGAPQLRAERNWQDRKKWTVESVCAEAKKFSSRSQFRRDSPSGYQSAKNLGILAAACSHMKRLSNNRERFIYAIELKQSSTAYIGLTHSPESRFQAHAESRRADVRKLISDGAIFRVLEGQFLPEKAASREIEMMEVYREKGWFLLNKAKGGALGGNDTVWDREKVFEAAKNCRSQSEFLKKYQGAYQFALRHNFKDEVRELFPEHFGRTTEGKRIASISQGGRPFYAISLATGDRRKFYTYKEAAESYSLDLSSIAKVLSGKRKTVGGGKKPEKIEGYTFAYIDE